MKLKTVSPLGRWLVLIVLCLAMVNTWARSPRAREACGMLQNIDVGARTLTLLADKGERPLEVIWKDETKFIKGRNFESASALQQGMRACIYYHTPFFGKRFVTKVVWTSSEPSPKKEK